MYEQFLFFRYCVFGETVTIATTMEATSIAKRIQISESSFKLLSEFFTNEFDIEYRGVIKEVQMFY